MVKHKSVRGMIAHSWALIGICLLMASAPAAAQDENLDSLRKQLDEARSMIQKLSGRIEQVEKSRAQTPAVDNDVNSRLDELEEQMFDLDERTGSRAIIHAFDAISLDIGGFLTQQFTYAIGEDSDEASFNATQFELLIKADLTDEISVFTALGFLRESDLILADAANPTFAASAMRNPAIIAWGNFQRSDALEIQLGRFVTPHGIINIEHFPGVLLELNQPQFLRPFSGQTIFSNFMQGGQIHGRFFLGEDGSDVLQYNAYVGLHPSDSEDFLAGFRVAYTWDELGVTLGGNYGHGRRKGAASTVGNLSIVGPRSLTTNDYDFVGVDLLYDKGKLLWKNELFFSSESGQQDRLGFYTQPAWRLNDKWIAFYRFDYFDPGQGIHDSVEHIIGVNFLPIPIVRLRASYIFKQLGDPEEDLSVFQFSMTLSF